MICIQKIYGFHGINRQNIEKSLYVTPVTDGRTDRRKVENRALFCWTRNRNDSFLPEKHHCIVLQFHVWVAESMNCNAWIFLSRSLFRLEVAETDEKVFSKKSRFNVLFFAGWLTSCWQLNKLFCVPFKMAWLIFIRIFETRLSSVFTCHKRSNGESVICVLRCRELV